MEHWDIARITFYIQKLCKLGYVSRGVTYDNGHRVLVLDKEGSPSIRISYTSNGWFSCELI